MWWWGIRSTFSGWVLGARVVVGILGALAVVGYRRSTYSGVYECLL